MNVSIGSSELIQCDAIFSVSSQRSCNFSYIYISVFLQSTLDLLLDSPSPPSLLLAPFFLSIPSLIYYVPTLVLSFHSLPTPVTLLFLPLYFSLCLHSSLANFLYHSFHCRCSVHLTNSRQQLSVSFFVGLFDSGEISGAFS